MALGYATIPSETNFFMIDLGRDAGAVRDALRARAVEVGRVFPALPSFLRVTVGTHEQMAAFLEAFRVTMA